MFLVHLTLRKVGTLNPKLKPKHVNLKPQTLKTVQQHLNRNRKLLLFGLRGFRFSRCRGLKTLRV